jgi:hypothetical protein
VVQQRDSERVGLAVVDEGERVGFAKRASGLEGLAATAEDGGGGCERRRGERSTQLYSDTMTHLIQ